MLRTPLLVALAFLALTISVRAQSTGSLAGQVVDDQNQPVIGASIRLVGATHGGISRSPDGSFRIDSITPGDYDVRVSAVGYEPSDRRVRIAAGEVTELNVGISERINAIVDHRKVFSEDVITDTDLDHTPRTTIPAVVSLQPGVTGSNTAGFSIRGAAPSQTTLLIDGHEVGDPFRGGFAGTGADLFPTVPLLALREIRLAAAAPDARYGNTLSGVATAITRSRREESFRGDFRFRTDVGALYGWSDPLTVTKAGGSDDTTLPAAKAMSQGSRLYEFRLAGPIGRFFAVAVAGRYNSFEHYDAGYETYDLSPEYAVARRTAATDLGRPALTPTNLGALPNTSAMVYDLSVGIRLDNLTGHDDVVEFFAEFGGMRREFGEWNQLYMMDSPAFRDPNSGEFVIDRNAVYAEREHQTINRNTSIVRRGLRYFYDFDQDHYRNSYLEITGTYSTYREETGRKDAGRSYGPFEMYDIYQPTDNGMVVSSDAGFVSGTSNGAIDRYEASGIITTLNPFNSSEFRVQSRNPLTGFHEGGESGGASYNPYGLTDTTFPAHGADRRLEFREAEMITVHGIYETPLEIGNIDLRLHTGFDLDVTTLRRHQNSLPWDSNPFFDLYGYEANYFTIDSASNAKQTHAQPFTPVSAALYTSAPLSFGRLLITPGIRLDLFDPNLPESFPLASPEEVTTKFTVSPRITAGYLFADGYAQVRASVALLHHRPEFVQLYDNISASTAQQGEIAGNPNLDIQRAIVSEIGCEAYLSSGLSLDIALYHRSVSHLPTVQTDPFPSLPSYYSTGTGGDQNVLGTQLSLAYRPVYNIRINLNYTLQSATGSGEPFDNASLSNDRTHTLHGIVTLLWGENDGPTIGGIRPLENAAITLTGSFLSGLPYTREDARGEPVGEFNGLRLPSVFETEVHIERGFSLRDIFGDGLGDAGHTEIVLFADVINLLNSTGAIGVRASRDIAATGGALFTVSADADNDGTTMNRQLGDFAATPFFRDIDPDNPASYSASQYDRFGHRLYNPYADVNMDGVVTQQEKYAGYQRHVAALQSQRATYQFPRQVYVGVKVRF